MEIAEVLQKIGYTNLRDFGANYRTIPLYRVSENSTSLSINKKSGNFYDFGAKTSGNIYKLIQLTLQLSTLDEAKEYAKINSFPLFQPHAYKISEQHNELKEAQRFDKTMLKRLMDKHDYWLNRGISKEIIEMFNGGIAFNGRMNNRYVFPIINLKDELVGFAGRIIYDNPNVPKWKLINPKKSWVYPRQSHSYIQQKGNVILVESIGNLLSLYEVGIKNVLVTFGIDISTGIIKYLLKVNINKIFILFDNDIKNTGQLAATKNKLELSNYFDNEQIVIITPPEKDINTMLTIDKAKLEEFCAKMGLCM